MHLITQPGQYDPASGTVGAWLCGVARNMARKQAGVREDPTDPADLDDDTDPVEAHVDRDSPLERVLRGEPAPELFRVPEDYKLKSHGAK